MNPSIQLYNMFRKFLEPEEDNNWQQQIMDLESSMREISENLSYGMKKIKGYSDSASPIDPVERYVTNYVVFENEPGEKGEFSGIRIEYTPLSLTIERAVEEEIENFLDNEESFNQGISESENIDEVKSLLSNIPQRKDYSMELAKKVINMVGDKMDSDVSGHRIVQSREENNDILRYEYTL